MLFKIEKAKKIYEAYSDIQLLSFAKKDGATLRPEILPVLMEELKKRAIGEEFIQEMEENYFLIRVSDILELQHKIEKINCPKCGGQNAKIVCSLQRTIISILINTLSYETATICCEKCKKREFLLANSITLVLGWWSIKGMFITPYTIFLNILNEMDASTADKENMGGYILTNYKELRLNEDNLESYLKRKK